MNLIHAKTEVLILKISLVMVYTLLMALQISKYFWTDYPY